MISREDESGLLPERVTPMPKDVSREDESGSGAEQSLASQQENEKGRKKRKREKHNKAAALWLR